MATLVRNIGLSSFTFPPPYRGILASGQGGICADSAATIRAAIGDQVGVLTMEEIADGQPVSIAKLASTDIPDGAVGTADLADLAVTTGKQADGSVTPAKASDALADSIPGTPTLAAAAEVGDAIVTTVTLKDVQGNTLAQAQVCDVWISDVAGGAPAAVEPDGAVAIGGGGVQIAAITAKLVLRVKASAAGTFTLSVTESTAKSFFVNVGIGTKVASQQITFAL